MKLFRRQTFHFKPEKKDELFSKLSEYTIKIVNERFSFIKENAKTLEENKV